MNGGVQDGRPVCDGCGKHLQDEIHSCPKGIFCSPWCCRLLQKIHVNFIAGMTSFGGYTQ